MSERCLVKNIDNGGTGSEVSQNKKHFSDLKLTFVEPKLIKHGDATEITAAGFFGQFSPGD